MRSDSFRRTSFSAVGALLTFAVVLGLSAYAADKKAAPGSVFAADKGKFNILLDGASIGREEFEIEPSGGSWTAKGSTSLKTPDGKSAKVSGTLTLQPDALEEAAPCVDNDAGHYVTKEHHDNTR